MTLLSSCGVIGFLLSALFGSKIIVRQKKRKKDLQFDNQFQHYTIHDAILTTTINVPFFSNNYQF